MCTFKYTYVYSSIKVYEPKNLINRSSTLEVCRFIGL